MLEITWNPLTVMVTVNALGITTYEIIAAWRRPEGVPTLTAIIKHVARTKPYTVFSWGFLMGHWFA